MEPLKFKDDVLPTFKNYKALREKQSGYQLKVLHTDRGGEYMGEFDDYLQENGITYEVTAPYSPEQNGKAERVNRTIMCPIWAIFAQQKLLSHYEVSLQKRWFIYRTKALSARPPLPYTKISKVRNRILVIFVFLDVEFGYIYPRKSVRSLMIDLIRAFMLAIKAQISTRYMILTAAKFLLQEMYILMKFTVMTEEILRARILLMISGIRKMMSFLQIPQILWMSASQFLSLRLFLEKVLKITPILMSYAAHHPFQMSQI